MGTSYTPADEIRRLQSLTADQLHDVIHDLELEAAGTRIYICVDPHEIYDFCFPIDPLNPHYRDIDEVADEQIALYEIFYGLQNRPILLPEYRRELESLTNYLNYIMREALRGTEVLRAFVEAAALPSIPEDGDELQKTELLNVYLALGLGVRVLGVDRFLEITSKRLQRDPSKTDIAPLWNLYRPTPLRDGLNQILRESIESKARRRDMKKANVERELRSAACDSAAIDRIVFLNSQPPSDVKVPPYLFLYFSSAPRTSAIFEHELVQKHLPRINGETKRLWRTRDQIFAYVVSKGFVARERDRVAARAQKLLRDFETTRASVFCEACPMHGGSGGSCSRIHYCQSLGVLAGEIQRRRNEILNLGLLGALRHYQEILAGLVPKDEILRAIIELLRKLASDENRLSVRDRLAVATRVVNIQTEFAEALQKALTVWETGGPANLHAGRDPVSAAAQYLPNRPVVHSPTYRTMLNTIVRFYETSATEDREKLHLFEKVCRDFITLDTQSAPLDPEHELIRCLLYLGLPHPQADQLALRHARRMTREFDRQPGADKEFRYVAGWAARRARKYWIGNAILGRAIELYPVDARFHHGRSLNTYSWLRDQDVKRRCPHSLRRAISDGEEAVKLYSAIGDPSFDELIAACHNNLAYFHAVGGTGIEPDSFKARKALTKLKNLVPPSSWNPTFPEYFETEARVEYAEAITARKAGNIALADQKLTWALTAVDAATVLKPKDDDYKALKRDVLSTLDELRRLRTTPPTY